MPITVVASPATLSWSNFTPVTQPVDPNDGSNIDALTRYDYEIPRSTAPRTVDGVLAYPESFTITVRPNAQVKRGVTQTPELLAHEQLHYDIGVMIARQFARELKYLRARTLPELVAQTARLAELHFTTRSKILQSRIDIDTRHGTNAHYQRVWAERIRAGVGNNATTQVGGFYL